MNGPPKMHRLGPLDDWRALLPTGLRFLLYAMLPALVIEWFVLAASSRRAYHLAAENAPLEWGQVGLLAVTIALLVAAARRRPSMRTLFLWLTVFPLWALIRELDGFLERMLFDSAWEVLAWGIAVVYVYVGWRKRQDLLAQMLVFVRSRAFVLFFGSFVTVIVLAQLIGQSVLWEGIMGDAYMRDVKRVVEELLEASGYCLAVCAGVECLVEGTEDRRAESTD
ncbi:MAG: hypothetical protein R6X33_12100 [Candidatus Brocadiia bacterium]